MAQRTDQVGNVFAHIVNGINDIMANSNGGACLLSLHALLRLLSGGGQRQAGGHQGSGEC